MKKLLIYYKNLSSDKVDYMLLDAAANVQDQQQNVALTAITDIAEAAEIQILLPAINLTLTTTHTVKVKAALQQQAIAYALEEQLLQNVDTLQFAILPQEGSEKVTVVISERDQILKILQQLKEQQLYPVRIIPDVLALPWHNDGWTIVMLQKLVLVRTAKTNGFTADQANLPLLLKCHQRETVEQPHKFYIYHDANADLTVFGACLNDGIVLESHPCQPTDLLRLFAENLPEPTINVLPPDFRPSRQRNRRYRAGLLLALLTAGWLSFTVVSRAVEILYLAHQQTKFEQQITAVYQKVFPQATSVVSPQFRFQQKLAGLQQKQASDRFINLLLAAGSDLSQQQGITVKSLHYSAGNVVLTLQTASLPVLNTLQRSWQKKNLHVTKKIIHYTNPLLVEFTVCRH